MDGARMLEDVERAPTTSEEKDANIVGDTTREKIEDGGGEQHSSPTNQGNGVYQRSGSQKKQQAPPFNCPEKIVIFLDISTDWHNNTKATGRGMSRNEMVFQLVKKAIAIFLTTKSTINPKHEFALVLLQDNDVLWYQEFTNDIQLFLEIMADLDLSETDHGEKPEFSMDQMLQILEEHCELPLVQDIALPPDYVIRAIFIYGRSRCGITFSDTGLKVLDDLLQLPYFFMDCLYIHEEPSELNLCEDIHSFLSGLNTYSSGYVFDVCNDSTILFEQMAKLLAHPLQRTVRNSSYALLYNAENKGALE